jgi:hypothetical protein
VIVGEKVDLVEVLVSVCIVMMPGPEIGVVERRTETVVVESELGLVLELDLDLELVVVDIVPLVGLLVVAKEEVVARVVLKIVVAVGLVLGIDVMQAECVGEERNEGVTAQ